MKDRKSLTKALRVGISALVTGLDEARPHDPRQALGRLVGVQSVGPGPGPVPADDLHAWVTDQPLGQRPGLTGRKHIDHAMGFHAGQDSGVGLLAADREVAHAQHLRRAELRI